MAAAGCNSYTACMTRAQQMTVILVLALWAAGLGAAAQFAKISVTFDLLTALYPGAGPGIGFMVSLVGLVGLVFGTTAGLLVQRLGYRRVLVGAMLLGAAMSGFQATLPGFWPMMASRAVEGASHLAIVVIGPTLIAQVTAVRYQSLAMTLWASFFGVSFAVTAWLGLPLAQSHGPQALFLAHAAFMGLVAVILHWLLPRDTEPETRSPLSLPVLIRQHGEIYASASVAAPALGFVFYTLMYVAILTLLPPMLPAELRGLVATGMPLVSIAVSLTLGVQLLRLMSAVRLVQVGLGLAALFTGLLWALWGTDSVVAAGFLLAGALGLIQGASFSAIPQLNAGADARARAAGAVAQLGNLGTTTGTPLLAALVLAYGISGVVVFALPLCIMGIAVHGWLATRRAKQT